NGESHTVAAEPHHTLLEVLREELGLTGTKHGCELGECGACTVLVDGRPVLSCLTLPQQIGMADVTTVEGLANGPELHPLQTAWAHLTGTARYADDIFLPRMLYGRLLRSTQPHARIKRLDISRALRHPGVVAIVTGADMPEKMGIMPSTQDETALAVDKVRYVGEPVAAIAATDEDAAFDALSLIDVDYEDLEPIFTIEEALEREDVKIHDT